MDYNNKRVVIRKKLQSTNDWVPEADGIVLENVISPKVTINLAKSRDSFSFTAKNIDDDLNEQFLSGDGSTTIFKMKYSPIPFVHLTGSFQKFFVYIDGAQKELITDYVLSDDELIFINAPVEGYRNIRIVYPIIETDDLVDMYMWKNYDFDMLTTQQKNDARKIEGVISAPKLSKVGAGNRITVHGYGLIDTIFSGMAFALFDPDTINRSHLAIQQIISQLNKFNPNRKIYGENQAEWDAIGNDSSPGLMSYNSKYRTAIEMIEELSGNKYTGLGQFIYWVEYNGIDDRYEFKWKAKPSISTNNITEGINPSDIKIGKEVNDVVNVVIYNCGNDCYDNGQEYLNYDFTLAGLGSKWKYESTTSTISQDLITAEFNSNISEWLVGNDNERVSNFPNTYPYTVQSFRERDITGAYTNTVLIADNNADFNEFIRTESKWTGKFKTDAIILKFSKPRYKGTLFIPYNRSINYALGDIYNVTLPSYGLNDVKLRITQIDYEFYGLTVTIEEDEATITL